jgi:hypothetical protein
LPLIKVATENCIAVVNGKGGAWASSLDSGVPILAS